MIEIPIWIIIVIVAIIIYEKWAKGTGWKEMLVIISALIASVIVGHLQ